MNAMAAKLPVALGFSGTGITSLTSSCGALPLEQTQTRQHHGVGFRLWHGGDHDGAIHQAIRMLDVHIGDVGLNLSK